MSDDARTQALATAQGHEMRGDHYAAAQHYVRAGAHEEAVRVLMAGNRFADAAGLLMRMAGATPAQVGALDAPHKRLAQRAALCFARAGDVATAVEVLTGLGEIERAADLLARSGDERGAARLRARGTSLAHQSNVPKTTAPRADTGAMTATMAERYEKAGEREAALQAYTELKRPADAARVAYALGRLTEAAQHFRDAGMMYECSVCLLKSGDRTHGLEALTQIPRDHPQYRAAVMNAIRLSAEMKTLGFELDQFVGRFVRSGPGDDHEAESIYQLARLYEAHGHTESAMDAYQKLVAYRPAFRDAAIRLEDLDETSQGSPMQFDRIVREEAAFGSATPARHPSRTSRHSQAGGGAPLPDLPELPVRTTRPVPISPSATIAAPMRPSHGSPERSAPTTAQRAHPGATMASGMVGSRDRIDEGSMIAGRYQVVRKIGQGGMATVYKVRDIELDEDIALKLFGLDDEAVDAQMVTRFKQELTLSRQLSHPNVVRLHDLGTHEGRKFITMELLAGTDLSELIDGPMDPVLALRLLAQACAGLQVAHDAGVVHRDIKPENFFVTNDGVVKLMDFGISKRKSAPTGVTVAGFMAGTPIYMSPEQIQNFSTVTHLTDVYALGVMAYEMLHGEPPFVAAELMPLLTMHLTHAPVPLHGLHPEIATELADLVMAMLAKKPGERPQSCSDVARVLAHVARAMAG